jgi:hypothetical protein
MTCDETRDSLSAYLDGALAPEERRDVEAHLGTCAECSRELASLRQTVALLQRVQPARAPVGFVDRVVAAARPRPWYRRVADAVFAPALTKLPLQATAVLLVGLLAVYLFERTPELQQAARQDTPQRERVAPVPPPTVPAVPPAEPSATRTAPVAQAPAEPSPADRSKDKADEAADKADPATPPAEPSAPPAPPTAVGQQDRRDARLSREVGGEVAGAPPAASTPTPAAPAPPGARETAPPPPPARSAPEPKQQTPAPPAPAEAESRLRLERSPDASRAPRGAPPAALGAKRAAPAADVVARVAVKDRDAAERDLAELIARVGGSVAERRREAETTVVEVLIPQPRYAEFTDHVARIGAWRLEAERPDLPTQIRVILRLQ